MNECKITTSLSLHSKMC